MELRQSTGSAGSRMPSDPEASAGRAGAALLRAERRQVARALHRSPVQLLAAACLRLQAASLDGPPDAAAVDTATREVEEAMLSLRRMMDRLASAEVEREVILDALVGVEADPSGDPGAGSLTVDEAAAMIARAAASRANTTDERTAGA